MFLVLEDRPYVTLLGLLEPRTASTEHGGGQGGGVHNECLVGGMRWRRGVRGPGSVDTDHGLPVAACSPRAFPFDCPSAPPYTNWVCPTQDPIHFLPEQMGGFKRI